LQTATAKIVDDSKHHTNAILNVCVAYTSRFEILQSIKTISEGVRDNIILPCDITEELFESCLYTNSVPDVLVRTSGETRLSDFLLWQSSFSQVAFFSVLWPELSLWHLYCIVLLYQQYYDDLQQARNNYANLLKQHQKQQNIAVHESLLAKHKERLGTFIEEKKRKETVFALSTEK